MLNYVISIAKVHKNNESTVISDRKIHKTDSSTEKKHKVKNRKQQVYKKTKAYLTADLASLKVIIFTLTN